MKNLYSYRFCRFIRALVIIYLLLNLSACKKFVEVDAPGSSANAANVFTNDATAAAVLTGIYTNLSKGNSGGFSGGDFTSISLFSGLSADEFTLYDRNLFRYFFYYSNSLASSSYSLTANYWNTIYPHLFVANSAIEGLTKSTSLTFEIKQQLLGEAKFIRAFCYFYLVNLFGDVPVVLSSDWQVNANTLRAPQSQVYQQIISDLKDAQELLSVDYLNSDAFTKTTTRVRPSKWVATALLARAYLYTGDFSNAEIEASKVINNNSLFKLVTLNNVFLKTSNEAIWQLQAVGTGTRSNTGEGQLFILPSQGPSNSFPVYLSKYIMSSFESGDLRAIPGNWVDTVIYKVNNTKNDTVYHPYKYKIGAVNTSAQEYCTVLRLAEQYLIRSEARARLGDPTGAVADLNIIRERSKLPVYSGSTSQASLLSAILHERQVELFTEWGHRWFDLKRTNSIDAVMNFITPEKGGTWKMTYQLYPIPQSELDKAPQLIQNSGY